MEVKVSKLFSKGIHVLIVGVDEEKKVHEFTTTIFIFVLQK